jgi:hypothetical protein
MGGAGAGWQTQIDAGQDARIEEESVPLRSPAAPKGGAEEKGRVTPLPSRSLRASRMTGVRGGTSRVAR